MEEQRPRVGIGVTIFKDGKILLGRRKTSHGVGEYSPPGGHLENMESFEECARREVMEETGLEITNLRFQYLASILEYDPKHYVQISFLAHWKSGEPQTLEPEKCEGWDWYDTDNLPSPMFKTWPYTWESLKTGKNYFDGPIS